MIYFILLGLSAVYLALKYVYSHWQRRGFPYKEPNIPFGSLLPLIQKKRSFGTTIFDLYNNSHEPFIGIYLLFRPAILVRDADLVRAILVKDFDSFHDRGVYCDEENDPTSANLFALPGQKWRNMRAKLTPTFTSGKLKSMMPTLLDVGDDLIAHMKPMANNNAVVEMKELMTCYVLNIIGSVFFGLSVDTFADPNSEFRQIAKDMTPDGFLEGLRGAASFLCPKVLETTGISALPKRLRDALISIVTMTFDHREKNQETRKDFMQLLMQLRNTGKVGEDGDWNAGHGSDSKSLTIEQCAAQVFVFFVAGFETSASTASFCLHELTKNPHLLEKLVAEIDRELEKTNGEVTYDSIKEMKFLEDCISETVRMYPALPILNRECTEDYPIPDSHLTIKAGTSIIISLFGMSRDPKYFPDPDTFRPDRFASRDYNETAYIPFGDGPRNCIGLRMGKMIAKVGLVKLLKHFTFTKTDDRPIEYTTTNVTLISKHGINLKVSHRK